MRVRVGHIEFLNCYPLYHGLRRRAEAGLAKAADFELISGVPTDLNRMLVSGTIDFGPISSIAYARNHRHLALSPRLSISSRGAVDSIQLVTRAPIEEISAVALTPKSATSVALLKTILKLRYGSDVEYVELQVPPAQALDEVGAVLLIGDEGLEAMYFPFSDARRYDLGQVWQDWTGLPMVYAVWAARREFVHDHTWALLSVEEELVRSMGVGRERADEVVDAAAGISRFGRDCLERYFRMLHYGFETEYQTGLRRYYELAHEAGELVELPGCVFWRSSAGPEEARAVSA